MSGYAQPDTFGSTPGAPRVTDPQTGITYTLGFNHATTPPTPIYVVVSTWAAAKLRWSTWAQAKLAANTWGQAKAVVAS